ncbi:hypothetical protein LTR93_002921 [Exophiala xenobiotica]|nr:hypothetical protein LTR93_002921 [Exophiala xenobiotica]
MLPGSETSGLGRVATVYMHKDRGPPDSHWQIWEREIEPRLLRELGQAINSVDWLPEFVLASRQNNESTLVSSVLITCESRGTLQDVRNCIDQAEWLRGTLVSYAFALFIIRGRFGGLVADGEGETSATQGRFQSAQLRLPLMSESLCGQIILVGDENDANFGYCTFGGTILVGMHVYGLVARHPFQVANNNSIAEADPLSSLGMTQELGVRVDESFAFNSSGIVSIAQTGKVKSGKEQTAEGISVIGAALPSADMKIISHLTAANYMSISLRPADKTADPQLGDNVAELRNSDCILMDLSNIPSHFLATMKVNKVGTDTIDDFWKADHAPSGRVSILLPGNNSITGNLQERQSSFPIDGKFLRVHAINLEAALPKGSSGAWVVSAGTLCGVIVGGRFDIARAYMMPMKTIVGDITHLFGETIVTLPSMQHQKASMSAIQENVATRSLPWRDSNEKAPSDGTSSNKLSNASKATTVKKPHFRFLRAFLPRRVKGYLGRAMSLSTGAATHRPEMVRPSAYTSSDPDRPNAEPGDRSCESNFTRQEMESESKRQVPEHGSLPNLQVHEYQLRTHILGQSEAYTVLCSADTLSSCSFISLSELHEAEKKTMATYTGEKIMLAAGSKIYPLGTVVLTFKISGFAQTWKNPFHVLRDSDIPAGGILGLDSLAHIMPDVRTRNLSETPPVPVTIVPDTPAASPHLPAEIRCWVQLSFNSLEVDSSIEIRQLRWMDPHLSRRIREAVDRRLQKVKEADSALSKHQIYFRYGSFQIKGLQNSLDVSRFTSPENLDEPIIVAICSFIAKYPSEIFELSIMLDFSSIQITPENDESFREMIQLEMRRKMVTNILGQKYLPPAESIMFQQHNIVHGIIDEDSTLASMGEGKVLDLSKLILKDSPKLFLSCIYLGYGLKFLVHLLEHHQYTDSNFTADSSDCDQESCQFRRSILAEAGRTLFPPKLSVAERVPQNFDSGTVIPVYYPNESETLGVGAFGTVSKVAVDPLSCDFPNSLHTSFALKVFQAINGDFFFYKELEMLSTLRHIPNDHIVTHCAAWVTSDRQYILYPLAKSNLRTFMLETAPPTLTKDNVLWFLHQLNGLATAIDVVHRIGQFTAAENEDPSQRTVGVRRSDKSLAGYHHDLKPENILVFESGTRHGHLTFKITDFGAGQFHRTTPNTWSQKTREPMGSFTYQAPDRALYGVASRPFDMFAMGCILLELLIWLLVPGVAIGSGDMPAIETFSDQRVSDMANVHHDLHEDRYWMKSKETVSLKPAVTNALDMLQDRLRDMGSFQRVLSVVRLLLQMQPDLRLKSDQLCHELSNIIVQVEADLATHSDLYLQQRTRSLDEAIRLATHLESPSTSSPALTISSLS